jgi:4-hydroxy-tetrahydrodipicolinate synthase
MAKQTDKKKTTGKSAMASSRLPKLTGVFSPTLTAFHSDGRINLEGTKKFVRFLLDGGVHGLAPLGSGGEPFTLSMDERKRVLDAIVEETDIKVPIYAGICEFNTSAAIDLGLHAKSIGCDGRLMVLPPYYLKPPKRDVLNFFRQVREKVGLPIMVYDVPSTTNFEITPAEIKMLMDEDVLQAVKWSHAEISRIYDTRYLCGDDFTVFVGNDLIAFGGLAVGADGWISGLPMMVPDLAVKLFNLIGKQDLDAARDLWYRLLPLVHLEFSAQNGDWDPHIIAVVREVATLRGLPVGPSRAPFTPVKPAVREQLTQILKNLGAL